MKTGDKIVLATLVIITLGMMLLIPKSSGNLKNKYAIIQVGDSIVKRVSLKEGIQGVYTFPFRDQTGSVEIKDGTVRMLPMNREICPAGICSTTGWIKNEYQAIACLPNKIIVTIEDTTQTTDDEIDIIAF